MNSEYLFFKTLKEEILSSLIPEANSLDFQLSVNTDNNGKYLNEGKQVLNNKFNIISKLKDSGKRTGSFKSLSRIKSHSRMIKKNPERNIVMSITGKCKAGFIKNHPNE